MIKIVLIIIKAFYKIKCGVNIYIYKDILKNPRRAL